ncbi:MAG: Na+/H+ antiporter [Planctomycetota bacterium]
MTAFDIELLIGLFAVVTALGIFARWLRIAYPILLVLGGLLLSMQPDAPTIKLQPDLVFLLFLPPLLYAAAFNTHWPAFRSQIRAISLLAIGLVLFTTVLVAAAAHYFLGLPWDVGFVLGAIVSPPDAVAATAITQRVKLPQIISTILEGESLVNDASALVAYKFAIAAVVYGAFNIGEATLQFFVMSLGGIGLGLVVAVLSIRMLKWLARNDLIDNSITILITLLTPYAVYLPAEHLHVSGVLATVAAGLWVGSRCESIFEEAVYIEAKAVWEMIEFLLNGAIFILIGFQLPAILEALTTAQQMDFGFLLGQAAIISAVVIVSRLLWMYPGAYIPRWFDEKLFKIDPKYPPLKNVFIVGWTGMRGIVSLAAALAIPATTSDGSPFPHRELIKFLAFGVIFSTLVLQGLSLPFLIRWLGITEDADADTLPEEKIASCGPSNPLV